MAASVVLSNPLSLSSRPCFLPRSTMSRPPASKFLRSSSSSSGSSRQITRWVLARTSVGDSGGTGGEAPPPAPPEPQLVGEDSAAFDFGEQKIQSWVYFSGILGAVLFVLNVAWLDGSNGLGLGSTFIESVSGLSQSHEARGRFSI